MAPSRMIVVLDFLLAACCTIPLEAGDTLFHSTAYTVTRNGVVEGRYEARAVSGAELQSTYKSAYGRLNNRTTTDASPDRVADSVRVWKQSRDLSRHPKYTSPEMLGNALYALSLEEMELDVRADGAFIAGEMWPGVWTRDVSYSILLSLAAIAPDASKTTLMAKVKDGKIIQDTGTGGSWPVSSDRMVWAIAAWEVYCVTGDKTWLAQAYKIILRSAQDDLLTLRDPETGLFCGESSFLDWREQTYPRWMDPKDIYRSKNLGTNAVHYETWRILARMSAALGHATTPYDRTADGIRRGMNTRLWQEAKGYYGQYLYGRNAMSLSSRAEGLGEALSILFDVAPASKQKSILSHMPVTVYGVPCIDPQIPNIPPYHNNAVWPFVEAFRGWASAKTRHAASAAHSIAAIWRASALYLTNKENLVAATGDFKGTEINSNRQLWSVAGNLAVVYRMLFGMSFAPEGLRLAPFVPKEFGGERTLENFRYRNSILAIIVRGSGSRIASVTMDGRRISRAFVSGSISGTHRIVITLDDKSVASAPLNIVKAVFAPETPIASLSGSLLTWNRIGSASAYRVYKDGRRAAEIRDTCFTVRPEEGASEYQVEAVDAASIASFLSEPRVVVPERAIARYPVAGDSLFVRLDINTSRTFAQTFTVPENGTYAIDFLYANGNGPINTDNKCALRTLAIDAARAGTIVMPQRGVDAWNDWGYTNPIRLKLGKGAHRLALDYRPSDENMNGTANTALIREIRLTRLVP
ncbi:MAG TPA: glycogen debranching protein [Bacteroidota bacterium]|nr:glycogen debranching protein [Bacteroidota bacterium]